MPKRVRMVAEILTEKCTGCRYCEKVCPTVAISMRERKEDEPGPRKLVALMHEESCYNAQACYEVCPDDAIVMHELKEPFEVGVDVAALAAEETERMAAICKKAGYPPEMEICVCTTTTAGEMAASIVKGAGTPEQVSLATGSRTGCQELCLQPIIDLLYAAGHEDMPLNPKNGFQWYGRASTLKDNLTPEMQEKMNKPSDKEWINTLKLDGVAKKATAALMSGKHPILNKVRDKMMPQMIDPDIQEAYDIYNPEQEMQDLVRFYSVLNTIEPDSQDKS